MLMFRRFDGPTQIRIRQACAQLWSREFSRNDLFIEKITVELLKQAFREKAKALHPDRAGNISILETKRREDAFKLLHNAYKFLMQCFLDSDVTPKPTVFDRKIVAIGGAKGGIGKSIFSSNLSIALSQMGFRVTAADMDLGGANLHLYMGSTLATRTIGDFILRKTDSLDACLLETKHGPYLLAGDSARLGSANINFQQKARLIRSLRKIDTDFLILDLGGDTSFHMIDFFLMADYGIIITTCDPASYLDAFNFLKVSVHRRLDRVFTTDSPFYKYRDPKVAEIIQQAVVQEEGTPLRNMARMMDYLRQNHNEHYQLLIDVFEAFRPLLIVNKADDPENAVDIARRIQHVAVKTLLTRIGYLGFVPAMTEIEASARDLLPVVAKYPDGNLSQKLQQMVARMLNQDAGWLL